MGRDRNNCDERDDRDRARETPLSEPKESDRGGPFQDRVEKLERPGDWPEPPAEKK